MASKTIPLTNGYFTTVDEEDFERLSQFRWQTVVKTAADGSRLIYAKRGVRTNGKVITIRMHQDVLSVPGHVDHADGDGLNNRRHNLRQATPSQNKANSRKSGSSCSSQFKGVTWSKSHKKWAAQIGINWKRRHLGYFREEVDAAQAYNFAAFEQWGEFARLNVPPEPKCPQL